LSHIINSDWFAVVTLMVLALPPGLFPSRCALTCTAMTVVHYEHRYKRPPRKKKGPDKSGPSSPLAKALREERALEGGEASADLTAFFKRMMRP
jgi:hypothetical protein